MTITQDTSAPLVVVCGATGVQGGSVIKCLAESDREYRFRGLTRDSSKPSARSLTSQGVEMVSVSLTVDNKSAVLKAFEGANIAFVVTNYWEHQNKQKEIDEGIMLVETAKAVGVDLLIWSGLDSVTDSSGGIITHFDSKATVTEYARKSGVPFVVVQAGFYASNFLSTFKPRKQADGSYAVAVPFRPGTVLPVIDMDDYGLFVREAIESPAFGAGTEVLSCGELISMDDCVSKLAQITGKKIKCARIGGDQSIAAWLRAKHEASEVDEPLNVDEEFHYYGGKDIKPSQQHLVRKPRTFAEYAITVDWAPIFE